MQRQQSDDLFLAIAHPVRRLVLDLLVDGTPHAFSEILAASGLSKSALSQHLTVLKQASLLTEIKSGRQRAYQLTPEPLLEVLRWMHSFEFQWHSRLNRLEQFLNQQDHDHQDQQRIRSAS